jgi:Type IV secretion system pilin
MTTKRGLLTSFFSIFILFYAVLPSISPVKADCFGRNPVGNCERAGDKCGDPAWCCDWPYECDAHPAPTTTQPGGQTTTSQTANTTLASSLCEYIQNETEKNNCTSCIQNQDGAWTAFGCISKDPAKFMQRFIQIATSIGGGIAFLLILFGGFQILTSAGNPEQLNAGKELISSAIAGLLFIIFSIFLLKIVGVNILGIPGFI